MPKVCEMTGVRELCEHLPVELWIAFESGRPFVRAYNEERHGWTDIDLKDLMVWVESNLQEARLFAVEAEGDIDHQETKVADSKLIADEDFTVIGIR